jgi:hypothetical protein
MWIKGFVSSCNTKCEFRLRTEVARDGANAGIQVDKDHAAGSPSLRDDWVDWFIGHATIN